MMTNFDDFHREQMKDPEFKALFDALTPQYTIISKMQELRIAGKYSQAELAKKVGTKQSAISRFEKGLGNPTVDFLKKMADALGVKIKITVTKAKKEKVANSA